MSDSAKASAFLHTLEDYTKVCQTLYGSESPSEDLSVRWAYLRELLTTHFKRVSRKPGLLGLLALETFLDAVSEYTKCCIMYYHYEVEPHEIELAAMNHREARENLTNLFTEELDS